MHDSFFEPMLGKLFNRLSNFKCLVAASNQWSLPSDLVIPGEEESLQFVEVLKEMSSASPLCATPVDYVHAKVSQVGGAWQAPVVAPCSIPPSACIYTCTCAWLLRCAGQVGSVLETLFEVGRIPLLATTPPRLPRC